MFPRLSRLAYLLLLLLMLLAPASVNAQSAATATLGALNTELFPEIDAYLDIHDAQGFFIPGLLAEHIRILEDEQQVTIHELEELRPGVQVVIALNPGASMGVQNSQAVSRYDTIKEDLRSWASSRRGSTIDDWSLLVTAGVEISHTAQPLEWIKTLDEDQVDARSAAPDLDTLFQAITLASDTPPRAGMSQIVLFVTTPPENQEIPSLENLFGQAIQQNIRIFVWLVTSSGGATTLGSQRLIELSTQTGGEAFLFTGDETLPSPEDYLEAHRSIYYLRYQSQLTTSGTHQVYTQVQIGGEQINSNTQSFELNIQPPIPALVSPPIQILREIDDGGQISTDDGSGERAYFPKEQAIQVVFDFPDGRKRALVYSAMYIDGVREDENLGEPFDQFTWDLDKYRSDSIHTIQIQVRDEFGLEGRSIETPVQISIERAAINPWATLQNNIPIITGLIVLVAGAILLLVLLLGGRLQPRTLGRGNVRRRKSDPVTQPVPIEEEKPQRFSRWVNRLQWAQRASSPKPYAFLTRISEKDYLAIEPPIPIIHRETAIGADPKQSNLVIEDPSIESIHAHIKRTSEGEYWAMDEGTIAGTWINYELIPKSGAIIEHGDLIHIGSLGFRFTMREPARVRKPVVTLTSDSNKSVEETHP